MNQRLLQSIDAWIIEDVFQPICNWLHQVCGCTNRLPCAAACFVSVVGVFPLITAVLSFGHIAFSLLAAVMAVYCCVRSYFAYRLITDEFDAESLSKAPDCKRVSGYEDRIVALLMSVPATPLIMLLFATVFKSNFYAIIWTIGSIANLCAVYFAACASPPRRKCMKTKVLIS